MWNTFQLALLREAGIAGNSVSAGLAALRKANYATPGLYSHAFFSLSIGLERFMKIIYILDFMLVNGKAPTDKDLRTLGHDLEALFGEVERIKARHGLKSGPSRIGAKSIEFAIVECLGRFARSSRYYNLDFVVGSSRAASSLDPIADWYQNVTLPILKQHLTPSREAKLRANAGAVDDAIGYLTQVAYTAEDGTPLTDAFSASYHTGITELGRKYGTFYSARVCRYLYYILWDLRHRCQSARIAIPYLDELFFPFMNGDEYLLRRQTFPPRSQ